MILDVELFLELTTGNSEFLPSIIKFHPLNDELKSTTSPCLSLQNGDIIEKD